MNKLEHWLNLCHWVMVTISGDNFILRNSFDVLVKAFVITSLQRIGTNQSCMRKMKLQLETHHLSMTLQVLGPARKILHSCFYSYAPIKIKKLTLNVNKLLF